MARKTSKKAATSRSRSRKKKPTRARKKAPTNGVPRKPKRSDAELLAEAEERTRRLRERVELKKFEEASKADDELKDLNKQRRILIKARTLANEYGYEDTELLDDLITDVQALFDKRWNKVQGNEEEENDEDEEDEEEDEDDEDEDDDE